jgi:hypothetical protein
MATVIEVRTTNPRRAPKVWPFSVFGGGFVNPVVVDMASSIVVDCGLSILIWFCIRLTGLPEHCVIQRCKSDRKWRKWKLRVDAFANILHMFEAYALCPCQQLNWKTVQGKATQVVPYYGHSFMLTYFTRPRYDPAKLRGMGASF